MQQSRVLRAGSSHTRWRGLKRWNFLLLVDHQRSSRSRPDIVPMSALLLPRKGGSCEESANNCGEPVGRGWQALLNLAASKLNLHMRQHADRILARDSGVAVGGKPIVKAIRDTSQQWQREKPAT